MKGVTIAVIIVLVAVFSIGTAFAMKHEASADMERRC
jgi:hypothetical protein